MWKRENLKPAGVRWATEVDSVSTAPLDSIISRVRQGLAAQQNAWDVLRVEYWGEGRVVVYPGSSASNERIDDVFFDLCFQDMRACEAEYDAMDDEDAADDLVDNMLADLRVRFAIPLSTALGSQLDFRSYGEPHDD